MRTWMPENGSRRVIPQVLAALELFVGLIAMCGGVVLAAGVGGLPGSALARTPFTSWLLPGLALLVLVGLPMLVAGVAVVTGSRYAGTLSIVAGVLLAGWLVTQVVVLGSWSVLQPAMFAVALAIIVLALMAGQRTGRQLRAAAVARVGDAADRPDPAGPSTSDDSRRRGDPAAQSGAAPIPVPGSARWRQSMPYHRDLVAAGFEVSSVLLHGVASERAFVYTAVLDSGTLRIVIPEHDDGTVRVTALDAAGAVQWSMHLDGPVPGRILAAIAQLARATPARAGP